jgi:hypothetical protein
MRTLILTSLLFFSQFAFAQPMVRNFITINTNPQPIVGLVVSTNALGQLVITGASGSGVVLSTNYYGSTGSNQVTVLTNTVGQLYLSNYFNTNATGGGGSGIAGVSNYTSSTGSTDLYTNGSGQVYLLVTNSFSSISNQFSVQQAPFNATGNGLLLNTAYTTNGSFNYTVTGASFTSANIGMWVHISGGSNNITGSNIFSVVSAVPNATTLTLTNSACFTGGPYSLMIGTDDTAAIQSWINFCCTNGYTGIMPSNVFCIAGNIVDPGSFTNHHNSQLILPNMPNSSTALPGYQPVFTIQGQSGAAFGSYSASTVLNVLGSTLWEMRWLSNGQSMLSGANFVTPIDSVTGTTASNQYFYNGVKLVINNMAFRCPANNQMVCLDLRQVSSASGNGDIVSVGNPAYGGQDPTNANSCGIAFPQYANNGANDWNNLTVDGFHTDLVLGEHLQVYDVALFNAEYAMAFWDVMGHASTIYSGDVFSCRVVLANTNNTTAVLDIITMSHENNAAYWGDVGYLFYSNGFPDVGVIQGKMAYYSDAGLLNNLGMGHNHPDISGAIQAFPTEQIHNTMYNLTVDGFFYLSNSTAVSGSLPYISQTANTLNINFGSADDMTFFDKNQLPLASLFGQSQSGGAWWLFQDTSYGGYDFFTPTYQTNTGSIYSGSNMTTRLTNTAFVFVGGGSGITNIGTNNINTNGAAVGSQLTYSAYGQVGWFVDSSTTIGSTVTYTNFVLNQAYTNISGSVEIVSATAALVTAGVTGDAGIALMVSNIGWGAYSNVAMFTNGTASAITADTFASVVGGVVSNSSSFYYTNLSTGSGNSGSIVPSSGTITVIGNASASGYAALGANQTFTGNNTFGSSIAIAPSVVPAPGITILTSNYFSPSNIVLTFGVTNLTASTSPSMQLSNAWPWILGPGSNGQASVWWTSSAVSMGGTVNYSTQGSGEAIFTNLASATVGCLASNGPVYFGNNYPTASNTYPVNTTGWAIDRTPEASTSTMETVIGTVTYTYR